MVTKKNENLGITFSVVKLNFQFCVCADVHDWNNLCRSTDVKFPHISLASRSKHNLRHEIKKKWWHSLADFDENLSLCAAQMARSL